MENKYKKILAKIAAIISIVAVFTFSSVAHANIKDVSEELDAKNENEVIAVEEDDKNAPEQAKKGTGSESEISVTEEDVTNINPIDNNTWNPYAQPKSIAEDMSPLNKDHAIKGAQANFEAAKTAYETNPNSETQANFYKAEKEWSLYGMYDKPLEIQTREQARKELDYEKALKNYENTLKKYEKNPDSRALKELSIAGRKVEDINNKLGESRIVLPYDVYYLRLKENERNLDKKLNENDLRKYMQNLKMLKTAAEKDSFKLADKIKNEKSKEFTKLESKYNALNDQVSLAETMMNAKSLEIGALKADLDAAEANYNNIKFSRMPEEDRVLSYQKEIDSRIMNLNKQIKNELEGDLKKKLDKQVEELQKEHRITTDILKISRDLKKLNEKISKATTDKELSENLKLEKQKLDLKSKIAIAYFTALQQFKGANPNNSKAVNTAKATLEKAGTLYDQAFSADGNSKIDQIFKPKTDKINLDNAKIALKGIKKKDKESVRNFLSQLPAATTSADQGRITSTTTSTDQGETSNPSIIRDASGNSINTATQPIDSELYNDYISYTKDNSPNAKVLSKDQFIYAAMHTGSKRQQEAESADNAANLELNNLNTDLKSLNQAMSSTQDSNKDFSFTSMAGFFNNVKRVVGQQVEVKHTEQDQQNAHDKFKELNGQYNALLSEYDILKKNSAKLTKEKDHYLSEVQQFNKYLSPEDQAKLQHLTELRQQEIEKFLEQQGKLEVRYKDSMFKKAMSEISMNAANTKKNRKDEGTVVEKNGEHFNKKEAPKSKKLKAVPTMSQHGANTSTRGVPMGASTKNYPHNQSITNPDNISDGDKYNIYNQALTGASE